MCAASSGNNVGVVGFMSDSGCASVLAFFLSFAAVESLGKASVGSAFLLNGKFCYCNLKLWCECVSVAWFLLP